MWRRLVLLSSIGAEVRHRYNAECRGIVSRYCKEWEAIVNRLGRWIDFEHGYRSMEPWYMESVWWVFEANQNYKDVTDPAITIAFSAAGEESCISSFT